jgi:hypothetical protein
MRPNVRPVRTAVEPPRTECDHRLVLRVTVKIEGSNWQDFQEVELPALPREGDAIETRYGTCIVTHADPSPDSQGAGKIVCRFPGSSS